MIIDQVTIHTLHLLDTETTFMVTDIVFIHLSLAGILEAFESFLKIIQMYYPRFRMATST